MILEITQLPPESWQQYREIRLEAVRSDPKAFGMSYEEELERSESQWRDFLPNMWFAVIDNKIVGMIGLLRDAGIVSKHRAHIISFWVKPEYRGQGIGKKLIQSLQDFAQTHEIRKLYLYVTKTQESAIRLYKSLGFEKVGELKEHTKYDDNYFDQYLMEWYCKSI